MYTTCDLLYLLWFGISKVSLYVTIVSYALQWRHNGRDCVSNHQPHHCLLNGLFRHRSKKTSKLRVTDLCEGNSPVTRKMFPFDDFIMVQPWRAWITITYESSWSSSITTKSTTKLYSVGYNRHATEKDANPIAMTSHKPHVVTIHRQFDCLSNSLFMLKTQKTSANSLHKGHAMQKVFLCHDVIMKPVTLYHCFSRLISVLIVCMWFTFAPPSILQHVLVQHNPYKMRTAWCALFCCRYINCCCWI